MKKLLGVLIGLAAAAPLAAPAAEPEFPGRVVKIVVPYTVGTGLDVAARTLGQDLSERWGVAVIVENRTGASGNIGSDAVARAAPDGYTLLLNGSTLVINPHIMPSIPFDAARSFAPVIHVASGTLAVVATASLPARDMSEFVAYVKGRPGELHYASPGNGTPHHVGMELLKSALGLDLVHVPYKGTASAVTDLAAGRIEAMLMPPQVAAPLEMGGKARILAAGATRRSPITPHVPTFQEQGLALDPDYWLGIFAPAATPQDVIRKLNADLNTALAGAAVRSMLENQGLVPTGGAPEVLARVVREDLERWGGVVRAAGITAD